MLLLFLLGVALEGAFAAVLLLGDLRRSVAWFLPIYGTAFAIYLTALKVAWDEERPKVVQMVLALAILFRLTLLLGQPTLSPDVYRYLWEGRIQAHGFNPYLEAPHSEKLRPLRDEVYERVEYKELPAIYPPLMELCFRALAWPSTSLFKTRVFFLLCDLGVLWILFLLLRRRGLPPGRVLVYAWSPLVLIEFVLTGHNDSLPLFLLLLSVYAFDGGWAIPSALCFSGAVGAKYFALFIAPGLAAGKKAWALIFLPLVLGLVYWPFAAAGPSLWITAKEYLSRWRFNDSLFGLVFWYTQYLQRSHKIVLLIFLAYVLYLFWKKADLEKGLILTMGAYFLLTPVLHPWYVTWIVPFLAFHPYRGWLLFTGTVILAYGTFLSSNPQPGEWTEISALKWLEYLPVYGLLIADYVGRICRRGTETQS
ncbi:MAG: hypothetical protein HYU64_18855 [Armatimonadetes bacterium]|nr:hypothetical protein [Armatimonadota bacterium]